MNNGAHRKETLIFACSGSSDVGEIADRAARELSRQNKGRMFCLAGVASRELHFMNVVAEAGRLFVIDGCPARCGSKTLEKAGFNRFCSITLTDCGLRKGESPATAENVDRAVNACRHCLSLAG